MRGGGLIISSVSVLFNVGGFWQLSVSVLGLLVKCCDSCDTSFRPRTHARTRKKQHIKPSNLFWKHNPQPPSRVFALSGTRAMLLTFHSIPGPRVGTDTDPPAPSLLRPHCFKNNTHKTYCGTSRNPHKIIHIFDPRHFFFHASFPPCAPGDAPIRWCHQQVIRWWDTSVLLCDENSDW